MSPEVQMVLAAGSGYLVGSISFALVIGALKGVDIRSVGSGNPGATNVKRALGRGAGNLVFILDFLKGFLPAIWPMIFFHDVSGLVPVLGLAGAILGHSFPIYHGFKGGKGVATTMGGLFAIMPVVMLAGVLAWLMVYKMFRVVSLASIVFALALPAVGWGLQQWKAEWFVNILGQNVGGRGVEILFSVLISLLILVRHRANIVRLFRGEELSFTKKD